MFFVSNITSHFTQNYMIQFKIISLKGQPQDFHLNTQLFNIHQNFQLVAGKTLATTFTIKKVSTTNEKFEIILWNHLLPGRFYLSCCYAFETLNFAKNELWRESFSWGSILIALWNSILIDTLCCSETKNSTITCLLT